MTATPTPTPEATPASPPDAADRERIRTDLATNLFVEAGAGAGKTSRLVARIVELVDQGVEIGSIAAITFTEKAAADLRRRLRIDLANAARGQIDLFGNQRFEAALDGLDHAPIGTLHAFARRLLIEFPVAAQLPPGFGVIDELESNLAFEERWEELLERLLDNPYPEGGAIDGGVELVQLLNFDGFGLHKTFRRVAVSFHDNWDLVAARVDMSPPLPWVPGTTRLTELIRAALLVEPPDDDKQAECAAEMRRWLELLGAERTMIGRLAVAVEASRLFGTEDGRCKTSRIGAKAKWQSHGGEAMLDELRIRQEAVFDESMRLLAEARSYRKSLVGAILGRWVLDNASRRAGDGSVEFHDLLVLARRLVSNHPEIRQMLHRRYEKLLLDEFQDTDPIQLEIAVRLAADPDDPAHDEDWTALRPLPGRLFIVGDPKQSIYRFRRADIAQYLRAADQIGAERATLSANFRSSRPVIDWVNHVFGRLIQAETDSQPEYLALEACRERHVEHGSVRLLGVEQHDDLADARASAEELRWREAADAADAVATALNEGWLVGDESAEQLRPCRPGDITILLPARTSLAALESALAARDIPYRAENSSVVYTTTDIRHVMLTLRAADDATDELALVAALRTGLYGCSDVELHEWKMGGGTWSIWRQPPVDLAHHPVAAAIAHIRSLAERATWWPPADLIAALVDERRLVDAVLDGPDARDVWRRIRFVVEQARAWSDAGGHGLRRYLNWVRLQAAESRTADTILPDHDDDAVRIMTIHAAKGLEFAITVVSGLTTQPQGIAANSVVWHNGTWTISSKQGDEIYDDFKPIDEQMSDAERRRLLYVACTRAVDHLVVSLHRKPAKTPPPINRMPSATLIAELGGALEPEAGAAPLVVNPGQYTVVHAAPEALEWADPAEWADVRDRALRAAGRRDTISATRLAEDLVVIVDPGEGLDEGLQKEPVDLELPPWQRGRYGTAIGRAVHGTLQFCDLSGGADITELAAGQCAAEGIIGFEATVEALARSALAAPIVGDALSTEHHRELFVAALIGDRVLEGYVDLLVRTPAGYLIVDYKTDAWNQGAQRAERIERYRRQLAAYALALEAVVGEPIVGGVLVHCRADGAAEQIELDDFAAAVDGLRTVMSVSA
jgi:ATP-dependent helicase/nuclease subunit A